MCRAKKEGKELIVKHAGRCVECEQPPASDICTQPPSEQPILLFVFLKELKIQLEDCINKLNYYLNALKPSNRLEISPTGKHPYSADSVAVQVNMEYEKLDCNASLKNFEFIAQSSNKLKISLIYLHYVDNAYL